jgi:soluble lytic murein transglycosylase-like protein
VSAYDAQIAAAAASNDLPIYLLMADIQHESGFDPFAIGDGGEALGLMQVHPAAAEDVGGDWGALRAAIAAKDEETAVRLSLSIGAAYLARQMKVFGGDQKLALMAYNQGPTVIARALAYAKAVEALMQTPPAAA